MKNSEKNTKTITKPARTLSQIWCYQLVLDSFRNSPFDPATSRRYSERT